MPEKCFRLDFTVRYGETCRLGVMRCDVFFDMMQEIAACHAEVLGIGFESVAEKKLIWVLSRIKLKVLRVPRLAEKITLTTWPSGINRLYALREFEFTDSDGNVLAYASSYWLLIDAVSYRPKRPEMFFHGIFPEIGAARRFYSDIDKIQEVPSGNAFESVVMESQIDINRHLNNTKGVVILSDWLACNAQTPEPPEEIQVNFIAASQLGSKLLTRGNFNSDNGCFYVETLGGEPQSLRLQCCGKMRNA